MNATTLHTWDVRPDEAVAIQRRLAPLVRREGTPDPVRLIAGCDISIGSGEQPGRAAVVIVRWPGLEPVEQMVAEAVVSFPYVPGLLSFRELPLLLPVFQRLQARPDLILVDGQGIAHPRRLGLASHLGLLLDTPTIGCAKSRLTGRIEQPLGEGRGARAPLIDKGEVVGVALRTRAGTQPIYVSVGHRIGLDAAARWVGDCSPRYRVPEPTRLAHLAAAGRRVAPVSDAPQVADD